MVDSPAILDAILAVSGASESAERDDEGSTDYDPAWIESILSVSRVSQMVPPPLEAPKPELVPSIFKVSHSFTKSVVLGETLSPTDSLLRAIGKASDENLHSDFIAALLNPTRVGELAYRFFDLLYHFGLSAPPPTPGVRLQLPFRELRLDQLNPNLGCSEEGARRIDVFVKRGTEILVIENKVWSLESWSQTSDYYHAVSGRYRSDQLKPKFLFLSPHGDKAAHKSFSAISYPQLHEILASIEREDRWSVEGMRLLAMYTAELGELFVRPMQQNLLRMHQLLTEAGYNA